jgi:putative ABC transport system substrate-binding protein
VTAVRSQRSEISKSAALIFALSVLCALFLGVSFSAEAQQLKKMPRLGVLVVGSPASMASRMEAFRQGLRELGYIDGNNIAIEYKYAEGKEDRLPHLVSELVRLNVDIILAGGGSVTSAAKNATKTIPIVMTSVSDPVGSGLVESLARPGGNITGSSGINPDLSGKRLELLKETIPGGTRIAVLVYRDNPAAPLMLKETEAAAQLLRLQLQTVRVSSSGELENAFEIVRKRRSQAINVLSSAFFVAQRKEIIQLAARNRLPAMYVDSTFTEAGGLMSYGVNILDLYRRAATYVDKILKGAKPAELPVEQPTKFELTINLKTAKQISLTIPQSVLYRAYKVIK